MSFNNLYYKRAVATAKPCYVCFRPTTCVLATINAVDFLYTCEAHLTDSGFTSLAPGQPAPPKQVSEEEIAKVKQEWEDLQKLKKEKVDKEKEKNGTKTADPKSDKAAAKEAAKKMSDTSPGGPSPPGGPRTSTHQQYILNRDYFAMRQGEHKKKQQTAQVKAVAPRFPGTPSGAPSGSS